ncbi:hypothetical protein OSTOST_04728 [Ostertagia ostertagi]
MDLLENLDRLRRYGREPVQRALRDRSYPFDNLSDDEFRRSYRFSRNVFFSICELLKVGPRASRDMEQILACLNKYLSPSIYLAEMLCRVTLQRAVIKPRFPVSCRQLFKPSTEKRASSYIGRMSRRARGSAVLFLINTLGFIDGTHCRIQRPHVAEGDFVNRKGYHSLNVGMVVDYDLRIRWVSSKFPGSAHDSRVFKTSELYEQLKNQELSEERYNRAVCSARARVERAFAVLKRQFHILHGECRYSPDRAAQIVVACCVLRNIAIGQNESSDYDEYAGADREDDEVPSDPLVETPSPSAVAFRQSIIDRYF